jgi:Rrf2 family protein
MRLSLQVQYAICGTFDLAYNGGGEPVQIRVVSDRQAIPARYLEQIFQRLRRAGLMLGKRGPGGGYTLALPPEQISLLSIVEALEGPLSEVMEMEAPRGASGPDFRPGFFWDVLSEQLGAALAATSLDSLCRQAVLAEVPRAQSDAPMYFI